MKAVSRTRIALATGLFLVGMAGVVRSETWAGGAGAGLPEWTNDLNWLLGSAPANPTGNEILLLDAGFAVTGVVNAVGAEWGIGKLSVNNTGGTHELDLVGKRLKAGNLQVGYTRASTGNSRLHIFGAGTLQVGSVDTPGTVFVGYVSADTKYGIGYLAFGPGSRIEAYLSSVYVGYSSRGNAYNSWGYLDLRNVEVVGGALSMDSLFLGSVSGAAGVNKSRIGHIYLDDTTDIQMLCVRNEARLAQRLSLKYAGKATAVLGDPDNGNKLPPGLNLQFGTGETGRCTFSMADARTYSSETWGGAQATIQATTNGTFSGWLSDLIVGRIAFGDGGTGTWSSPAKATLDLGAMTNCNFDVQNLVVGVGEGSPNAVVEGILRLPPGSGIVGTAVVGDGDDASQGLVHLRETRLTITNSLSIHAYGRVACVIGATSSGLDLAEDALLSIAAGGKIMIDFGQTSADPLSGHYGLRWGGDKRATLEPMVGVGNGIEVDDEAVDGKAEIYLYRGATYIGVPPPRGSVLSIR